MARFINITVVYNNHKRRSMGAYTVDEPEKRNSVIDRSVIEKLITNMKIAVGHKRVLRVFVRHQIHRDMVAVERVIQQYNSLDDLNPSAMWKINKVLFMPTDHDCPVKANVKYVNIT